MNRHPALTATLLSLTLGLAACGNKGPLTPPPRAAVAGDLLAVNASTQPGGRP